MKRHLELWTTAALWGSWTSESFLTRGIVSILLGIILLTAPLFSAAVFGCLIGLLLLLNGIEGLAAVFAGKKYWLSALLFGILSILLAIVAWTNPFAIDLAAAWSIGLWFLLGGFVLLFQAFRTRLAGAERTLLILSAILTIVLGFFLTLNPLIGAISLLWVTGVYALASGIYFVVLAIVMRKALRKAAAAVEAAGK